MASVRSLALLVAASFLLQSANANGGIGDIQWENRELIIRGDYFRVCVSAYEDFSRKLSDMKRGAQKNSSNDFSDYFSRIENYNIELSVGDDIYVVRFYPRLSRKFPGVFGGGARYIFNAKTFDLISKEYWK